MNKMPLLPKLFSDVRPNKSGYLALDERHVMYWEESGNPNGIPIVFLHGGPGAGASFTHRRFFDPQKYRIVIFDQRGCGRSSPIAETINNTTHHLISDMESLRRYLDVDRWIVFGGSWGATLALIYAIHFPERCLALVIRGVFLGTRGEIDWFCNGMRYFFPENWNVFAGAIPPDERSNLLEAYYRRLMDPDPDVHNTAASLWARYEASCSSLIPRSISGLSFAENKHHSLALARIEAHYFINNAFLAENEIMENWKQYKDIPGIIVHGRYDVVCPIKNVHALSERWPSARLEIIPDAGHSANDPGIQAALVGATEELKTRFG
jgi:proline iminopeptidase